MRGRGDGHMRWGHHSGRGGGRYLGRGRLPVMLLRLIADEPMHGYQMMKALEEQSDGAYSPSAGSIYPALQMLVERGLADAKEEDGKKIYAITEAGRKWLAEHARKKQERAFPDASPENPESRPWSAEELRLAEAEWIRLLVRAESAAGSHPDRWAALRRVLDKSARHLSDLLDQWERPR